MGGRFYLILKGVNKKMKFLTTQRLLNAWYQALTLTNKNQDEKIDLIDFPFNSIQMEMKWDCGLLVQIFSVKLKGCWVCDIRNDDRYFYIEQYGKGYKKEHFGLNDFVKRFIPNLIKELENEWRLDYY